MENNLEKMKVVEEPIIFYPSVPIHEINIKVTITKENTIFESPWTIEQNKYILSD